MEKILNPPTQDWQALAQRPLAAQEDLLQLAERIFADVKRDGDKAVQRYALLYDRVATPISRISQAQIDHAETSLSGELKQAIQLAATNIERFHSVQHEQPRLIETTTGVHCWRESRPIDRIGLYVPGGSAPLFSTVLMLGLPARLAGCKEIVLCSPAGIQGTIHPAILYAASLSGITSIFGIGGMQAIAAMTSGTETVPRVDKLFGPGNQYVTAAKQWAQLNGTAIDMPAGPSEVLVIADRTCNPAFVAADLLSQAEHGADSQVMLLSDKETVIDQVLQEVQTQLVQLPRKDIAARALQHSKALLLNSKEDCFAFSNLYAPEHLILAMEQPASYTPLIRNAGSVFLGHYSCESAGDYASGTNHTLPTNGYARSYSGISLDSFVKKISFQELTAEGIRNIGPAIALMAEAEELYAHQNAVTIRLKNL
jgi:histidinol dehydrogenase